MMNLGLIDNVSGDVFQAFETMRLIAHQRLSRHDPAFVYLVHTISGDYGMDAGIAREINNRSGTFLIENNLHLSPWEKSQGLIFFFKT